MSKMSSSGGLSVHRCRIMAADKTAPASNRGLTKALNLEGECDGF